MPPHKQPPRLLALAENAAVKLILDSMGNIDKMVSIKKILLFHQESITTVQRVLLQLPRTLFDSLFDSFCANFENLVPRWKESFHVILYKIIMEHKKKIRYPYLYSLQTWNIANIVELDLTPLLPHPDDLNNFVTIGRVCKKLEKIEFSSDQSYDCLQLLAGCTELRYISCTPNRFKHSDVEHDGANLALTQFRKLEYINCDFMGSVLWNMKNHSMMEDSDSDEGQITSVNLRYVKQFECGSLHMETIISMCPHLDRLHLNGFYQKFDGECSAVFEELCTSSLELRHLTVSELVFDANVEEFFTKKGEFLRTLSIQCDCPIPQSFARLIAKTCVNLTHLTVKVHLYDDDDDDNDVAPYSINAALDEPESRLTQLREFVYESKPALDFPLLMTILPRNCGITSLKIATPDLDIDDSFVKFINSTAMKSLAEITLKLEQSLSIESFRALYEKWQSLTLIDLHCVLDDDADDFLDTVREDIELQNLDLYIDTHDEDDDDSSF